MTIDLSQLPVGQGVFVEIWGKVYTGEVRCHLICDGQPHVQITTEAARAVMQQWVSLHFRCHDGQPLVARGNCRLIVPTTQEEVNEWFHKSRRDNCRFAPELGFTQ